MSDDSIKYTEVELEGSSIFNLSSQAFFVALKDANALHESDEPLINCFFKKPNYTQSAPQLAEQLGYSDIGPVNALVGKFANKKNRDCYEDSTPFENKGCYMTLKFLCRYEDVFADMDGLEKNGVPVVRKLMEIPAMALEYIQKCEKEDREVQRFDGIIPSDIPADHWSLVGGDEEELKEQAEKESKGLSDSELYAKAKQQGIEESKERATTTLTYVRNTYVAEASKRRANGICQLCGNPASFNDKNGNPYLESHHIVWLSEGGADVLENIAALCPNCHKKMHVVNNPEDMKKLNFLSRE